MRPKTYDENQLQILRQYYPDGKWDQILPYFPNKTKADIRAIARKNSIKRIREHIKDEDITGQRFNRLIAISRVKSVDRFVRWKCTCDCGNETIVDIYSLKKGAIKSCGCLLHKPAYNAKDLTGMSFGLLKAVERLPRYKGKDTYYRCICECGRETIVLSGNLSDGNTRSCGVQHKKKDFAPFTTTHNDSEQIYSVYRHISPVGKSYIGITRQDPERRFQNGYGYKTQVAFHRAIQKYGWESFQHEILEENLTEKEACEKEAYYISEVFNSFAPNGYNTREGGTSGRNYVTPIIQYYKGNAVNFFESISIASKELGIAQKTIRIHCGNNNAIGDYYFIQMERTAPYNIPTYYWELNCMEHIEAMKNIVASDTRNIVIARNKKSSKPINKYDLDGHYICTFSSITEARNSITNSTGGGIAAAVNPNRAGNTAYGYMWKFDIGNHDDINPIKYKTQKTIIKMDNQGKIIEKYRSMSEASRKLGVSIYVIRQEIAGKDTYFEGFYLRYYDSTKESNKENSNFS